MNNIYLYVALVVTALLVVFVPRIMSAYQHRKQYRLIKERLEAEGLSELEYWLLLQTLEIWKDK